MSNELTEVERAMAAAWREAATDAGWDVIGGDGLLQTAISALAWSLLDANCDLADREPGQAVINEAHEVARAVLASGETALRAQIAKEIRARKTGFTDAISRTIDTTIEDAARIAEGGTDE